MVYIYIYIDGPSSVWIYAQVQTFWPRKKTRLRWFYSNPHLCSTKQQNMFNRRCFIQQNKTTKHPLSIDVSNIKPLAIITLKRQTGSMDGLLWKSQTTKLKSIYLHYKAHATPHRVYSQIVTEPGSSMKITLTSQPDQDRKKTVFRFLFARLVFFSPDFVFFSPGLFILLEILAWVCTRNKTGPVLISIERYIARQLVTEKSRQHSTSLLGFYCTKR